MPKEPWEEIARIGRKVVQSRLTSSRFGNISLREGPILYITCTGSMLDEIDSGQVVAVDIENGCSAVASSETCVHQSIYRSSGARAVIHTHSPYAVTLSMIEKNMVMPIDSEGIAFLGPMPVVEGGFGSSELAANVSSALREFKACIARGHGVFASGDTLSSAYTAACMAEHSSQVSYLVRAFQGSRH